MPDLNDVHRLSPGFEHSDRKPHSENQYRPISPPTDSKRISTSPSHSRNRKRTLSETKSPNNYQETMPHSPGVMDHIVISMKEVGYLLGNNGEPMRDISARSGATVTVDHEFAGPSKRFEISGSLRSIEQCKKMIEERLEQGRTDRPLSVWIPIPKIGLVIGMGGATIRHINAESGAFATVQNAKIQSNCKQILIHGPRDCTLFAERMIVDIVEGRRSAKPPPREREEVVMKTIYVPAFSVGLIIGRSGNTLRSIQSRSGATIRIESDEENAGDPDRKIVLTGDPEAIQRARSIIDDLIDHSRAPDDREPYGRPPQGQRNPPPPPSYNDYNRQSSGYAQQDQSSFQLSADQVRLLIGRNGTTIREMENRSGTVISITGRDAAERNNAYQTVSITGDRLDVKIAKVMIEDRLDLEPGELSRPDSKRRRLSRFNENKGSDGVPSNKADMDNMREEEKRFSVKEEVRYAEQSSEARTHDRLSPNGIDTDSDPKSVGDDRARGRTVHHISRDKHGTDKKHSVSSASGGDELDKIPGKDGSKVTPTQQVQMNIPGGTGAVVSNSFPQFMPTNAIPFGVPPSVNGKGQIINGQIQAIPQQLFQIPFGAVPGGIPGAIPVPETGAGASGGSDEKGDSARTSKDDVESKKDSDETKPGQQFAYMIYGPQGPQVVYSGMPMFNGFPPGMSPQFVSNGNMNGANGATAKKEDTTREVKESSPNPKDSNNVISIQRAVEGEK